jgi:hypothetical protein
MAARIINSTSTVVLPARIFTADVANEVRRVASPNDLGALLDLHGYIPDTDFTADQQLVRAMIDLPLKEVVAELDETPADVDRRWQKPYVLAGISEPVLEIIRRLRLRTEPDFCELIDLRGLSVDNDWMRTEEGYRRTERDLALGGLPAVYTLPVEVEVPVKSLKEPPARGRPVDVRTVRPFGCGSPGDAGVVALAEHLAPLVGETYGGADRLRRDPVLVSIAAMGATVWTAMHHPKLMSHHDEPRLRLESLEACLDALDLGAHRGVAERIIRRDHPEHLPVLVRHLPNGCALPTWYRGLGIFAVNGKGYVEALDQSNPWWAPTRVLTCLTQPEPY